MTAWCVKGVEIRRSSRHQKMPKPGEKLHKNDQIKRHTTDAHLLDKWLIDKLTLSILIENNPAHFSHGYRISCYLVTRLPNQIQISIHRRANCCFFFFFFNCILTNSIEGYLLLRKPNFALPYRLEADLDCASNNTDC